MGAKRAGCNRNISPNQLLGRDSRAVSTPVARVNRDKSPNPFASHDLIVGPTFVRETWIA